MASWHISRFDARPASAVVLRYGAAVTLVVTGLGTALILRSENLPHPFTSFSFAAIAITFWYGGTGPRLLALLLSYLAMTDFFIPVRLTLWFMSVKRCKVKKWIWSIAILLATISSGTVPAQQQHIHQHSDNSMDGKGDWSELMASMEKMHIEMESIDPSGDGDVDFVRLMLPHHQAAIDMAKTELMHGKDPEMRRLAQEIIADQQSEIELMQLWLKQHEPQK
jgi:hypothetical protein